VLAYEDEVLAAVWPSQLRSLSATAIKGLHKCPEQFRRERIQGERQPPGIAMVWGTADHAAHDHNYRQKITTGEDLPVAEVSERFLDELDKDVDVRGGAGEIDWTMSRKAVSKADVQRRGMAVVQAYHEAVSPLLQPLASERSFELRVEGVPVPVRGRIDLETRHGVIDRKLSGRAKSQLDPEWTIQAGLYSMETAASSAFHLIQFDGRLHLPRDAEVNGRLPFRVPYTLTGVHAAATMVRQAADLIAHFVVNYGLDDPWPGNPTHPWACGYCAFRPTCLWYAGLRGGEG
jgi:PD-(D/E)XK nuclease superfamily